MIPRDSLVKHLNAFLEVEGVADYGPNGLQVEGTSEVGKIVTGVTASLAFIEKAVAAGANAAIVHHGIFWDNLPVVLKGHLKKRVQALLDAQLNLIAYHLPLDRHAEVGNSAPALRDLGVLDLEPFAQHRGIPVGWKGRFPEPLNPSDLLERVRAYYGTEPVAFMEGPEKVSTIALVSGAAQSDLNTAVNEELDVFITGEVSEFNPHVAVEEGIHHLSVGHHASERTGPKKLAEHIATRFDVDVEFLDVPNPV